MNIRDFDNMLQKNLWAEKLFPKKNSVRFETLLKNLRFINFSSLVNFTNYDDRSRIYISNLKTPIPEFTKDGIPQNHNDFIMTLQELKTLKYIILFRGGANQNKIFYSFLGLTLEAHSVRGIIDILAEKNDKFSVFAIIKVKECFHEDGLHIESVEIFSDFKPAIRQLSK